MTKAPEDHSQLVALAAETTAERNSIELMMLKVGGATYCTCPAAQRPGQPADCGADHECPQLEAEGVDAHHLRGVLVLPDGHPGPAHSASFEVADQHQDGHDQDQSQPEPPCAVVGVAMRIAAGEHAVRQIRLRPTCG